MIAKHAVKGEEFCGSAARQRQANGQREPGIVAAQKNNFVRCRFELNKDCSTCRKHKASGNFTASVFAGTNALAPLNNLAQLIR